MNNEKKYILSKISFFNLKFKKKQFSDLTARCRLNINFFGDFNTPHCNYLHTIYNKPHLSI